jgi:hypothetical protein
MKTFADNVATGFTITYNTNYYEDPEDYAAQIKGNILDWNLTTASHDPKVIGVFSGTLLTIGGKTPKDFFEGMDCESQELYEYWEAINSAFKKPAVEEAVIMCNNLVIIRTMEIEKEYRGKNLGLEVFNQIIHKLPSSLFVILPCPLNIFSDPKYQTYDCGGGRKKLIQYWKKLGFERLFKNYYYLDNNKIHKELREDEDVVESKNKELLEA